MCKGKPSTRGTPAKQVHTGAPSRPSRRRTGFPLWVSGTEPGSTHDLTAARDHALGTLYAAASHGLPTLADGGYEGTGIGVHTPIKRPPDHHVLDADNRTYNPATRTTQPWRTRIRPPHRPVSHRATHHCQPTKNRQHHPSRTRTDPPRTPSGLKLAEITSVRDSIAFVV